ncbi:ferredoxin Fer [Natronobiforma cellulositropha]|uniref:ferredoxin Fer n=1 Tax=Natronobiforma cellulositropha TaxID=1679076 RepID=UPI0021D5EFDF|nr:ferredoxin Fer [Natronobiforma cellulositropha]
MESPFEVLSVDPDASDEEIERAYRRRIFDAHPDHGGSAAEFQRVRTAYLRLTAADSDHVLDELEPTADGDDETPDGARVEYLSYDVLEDYGWELEDDDLFERASACGLDPDAHGRLLVEPNESLLEAAENRGFAWPYACRGGACANCAVAVVEGDLSMPVDHILPSEMLERGIRLSCVGAPTTEETKVVYDVKYLPSLDDLRLPPRPFEQARLND